MLTNHRAIATAVATTVLTRYNMQVAGCENRNNAFIRAVKTNIMLLLGQPNTRQVLMSLSTFSQAGYKVYSQMGYSQQPQKNATMQKHRPVF